MQPNNQNALTPQEMKIVEFGKQNGKTPDEIKLAVAKYNQSIPQAPATTEQSGGGFLNGVKNFVGGAVYGLSAPGRTIQNKILDPALRGVFGENAITPGQATKQGFEKATTTNLDSTSGKVGEFVGEAATYLTPGGASRLPYKIAGEGIAASTKQAVSSGEINSDTLVTGLAGAAAPVLGAGAKALGTTITDTLPTWLVTPLLKQAKDAKIAGKDITQYLIDSGRVGSVPKLVERSQLEIGKVDDAISLILKDSSKAGEIVPVENILGKVSNEINSTGGDITENEIKSIVAKLVPQAKGLLQKENPTVNEANRLRQLTDSVLGERGFISQQLPFNKEVLKAFTNTLRETVKASDERLAPLFDTYSKEITLRDALLNQANSGVAKNSIGLYDLLAGGAAFTATGNPILAAGAVGARHVLESPQVKTLLAQTFKSTEKLKPVFDKLSPAAQATILEFISSLNTEDTQPTQTEQAQ